MKILDYVGLRYILCRMYCAHSTNYFSRKWYALLVPVHFLYMRVIVRFRLFVFIQWMYMFVIVTHMRADTDDLQPAVNSVIAWLLNVKLFLCWIYFTVWLIDRFRTLRKKAK